MKLVPVNSDESLKTLGEFRDLLQSAMGPSGFYKILVTGGGYLELTASSSLLLERLESGSPICKYISQVAKGLPNFGLYFGVFVSELLKQRWTHVKANKKCEPFKLSEITEFLREVLYSTMICKRVDFGSIKTVLPLVKCVLSSKGDLAVDFNVDELSMKILKAFLNSVDEITNSVGRVHVKVENGPSLVSSHRGLLYELVDGEDLIIVPSLGTEIKVVIFTLKLNIEQENSVTLAEIIEVLARLVYLNVNVVACQKTVANDIKLFLRRRNILLLERMGTDFTSLLLEASNSFPISQLSFDLQDLDKMLGSLSSVQHVEHANRNYILLQKKEATVVTLLVQTRSLLGEDHLKGLIYQAVNSLKSLASKPFLTFGGGCLEVWLIGQLALYVQENCSESGLSSIARWVQKALLRACGTTPPTQLDPVYHHGWSDEDSDTHCRCGAVSRNVAGQLIYIRELISCSAVSCLKPPQQTADDAHLVDLHQHKLNTIHSALETFANLSEIGLILYDNK